MAKTAKPRLNQTKTINHSLLLKALWSELIKARKLGLLRGKILRPRATYGKMLKSDDYARACLRNEGVALAYRKALRK